MKHEQYTLKNGLIIRKHGFSISQTMPLNIVYKVLLSRATTYSAWCVALSKKKDVVVKKIFKNYIGFLGYPKKILIGNGGEFCNNEFKTLYEIFNIRICTTAAESPWNSDLIERQCNSWFDCFQNDTRDKLWPRSCCSMGGGGGVSVYNSMKNVNRFSKLNNLHIIN